MAKVGKLPKPPRHPLDKEAFLQGNRSRFTIIFIFCMFVIMFCEAKFHVPSAAYLSFMTFIGSFYLGGATLSAYVSANKSETLTHNVVQTQVTTSSSDENKNVTVSIDSNKKEDIKVDETINSTSTENININEHVIEEGVNAPEVRPFSARATGDDDHGEFELEN